MLKCFIKLDQGKIWGILNSFVLVLYRHYQSNLCSSVRSIRYFLRISEWEILFLSKGSLSVLHLVNLKCKNIHDQVINIYILKFIFLFILLSYFLGI